MLPGDELVKDNPQAVNVSLRGSLFAIRDLW